MSPFNKTNRRRFRTKDIKRKIWWIINIMKNVLSLDETPSVLEGSVKVASKLKCELPTDLQIESIPLKELSSLAEEIHIKTQEASQNTDLDMEVFRNR